MLLLVREEGHVLPLYYARKKAPYPYYGTGLGNPPTLKLRRAGVAYCHCTNSAIILEPAQRYLAILIQERR